MVDDLLRDYLEWDSHVFWAVHDCVEVEVGDIHSGIFCIGSGDGAVDVAFYGGHVDSGCAGGTCKIVVVVGDGETDSVHFRFQWF